MKTERLLLRPFKLEDVHDVYAFAKDPKWAEYLPGVPQPFTREEADRRVARIVLRPWETKPIWAIVLDGKVIGHIALKKDLQHETAELGYAIGRSNWRKGLVTEAAKAVMEWGFEENGLAKIFAKADLRNVRSLRVMEKLGMVREGVLRSHVKARGERIDGVFYGLLREEWEELKRE